MYYHLITSAKKRYFKTVKLGNRKLPNHKGVKLLAKTKEANLYDRLFKHTTLMTAAKLGLDEYVNILAKTEEVGAKDICGRTALMWVTQCTHTKCVKILSKTKELGMKDKYG